MSSILVSPSFVVTIITLSPSSMVVLPLGRITVFCRFIQAIRIFGFKGISFKGIPNFWKSPSLIENSIASALLSTILWRVSMLLSDSAFPIERTNLTILFVCANGVTG